MPLFDDILGSIFLMSASIGALIGVCLLFIKKQNQSVIWLSLLLISFSYEITMNVAYWSGWNKVYVHLNSTNYPIPFLYGPFLYFFLVYGRSDRTNKIKHYLLHFIPFLFCVGYFIPFYLQTTQTKYSIANNETLSAIKYPELMNLLFQKIKWEKVVQLSHLISFGFYVTLLFRNFFHEIQQLNKFATVSEQKYSEWLKLLFILMTGYTVSYLVYFVLNSLKVLTIKQDYFLSLAMVGWMFSVFVVSIKRILLSTYPLYQEIEKPVVVSRNYMDKYSQEFVSLSAIKLCAYMKSDQPYLIRELRIQHLAEAIQLSSHQLSAVINSQFEISFNDYINQYRVDHAKMLIGADSRNMKLLAIAIESGFSNKGTFITAFRKFTGLTPSEYREQLKEEQLVIL